MGDVSTAGTREALSRFKFEKPSVCREGEQDRLEKSYRVEVIPYYYFGLENLGKN